MGLWLCVATTFLAWFKPAQALSCLFVRAAVFRPSDAVAADPDDSACIRAGPSQPSLRDCPGVCGSLAP